MISVAICLTHSSLSTENYSCKELMSRLDRLTDLSVPLENTGFQLPGNLVSFFANDFSNFCVTF